MAKCTRKLIDAEAAKDAIEKIRSLGIDGDTSGLKSVLSGMMCDAFSDALDALPDASESQQAGDGAEEK